MQIQVCLVYDDWYSKTGGKPLRLLRVKQQNNKKNDSHNFLMINGTSILFYSLYKITYPYSEPLNIVINKLFPLANNQSFFFYLTDATYLFYVNLSIYT